MLALLKSDGQKIQNRESRESPQLMANSCSKRRKIWIAKHHPQPSQNKIQIFCQKSEFGQFLFRYYETGSGEHNSQSKCPLPNINQVASASVSESGTQSVVKSPGIALQ